MLSEDTEDITSPVSESEVRDATKSPDKDVKIRLVRKILGCLNEKRDSYNGVISSLISVVDCQDELMIANLNNGLFTLIHCNPISLGGKMFMTKASDRLVVERPMYMLSFLEQLVRECINSIKPEFRKPHTLRVIMNAIMLIRRAEQSRDSRLTTLSEEEIELLCNDAIARGDDQTKVNTLLLQLESRVTTNPLSDRKLWVFKRLFQDALSFQEPALRQIFMSQTNKLLKRIEDSYRVVMRDHKRYSDEDRFVITLRYTGFLRWLLSFCIDSIYCNAYFGSFVLTISAIKLLIKHIQEENLRSSINCLLTGRRCCDSILSCLNDSFEENKAKALELLEVLPCTYLDEVVIREIAFELASSINPSHSLTSQYTFKLLDQLSRKKSNKSLTLKFLIDLVAEVDQSITGQIDESGAFKSKPIYPKLTCIRALLGEIDFNNLDEDRASWELLGRRVVSSLISASHAVSSIVCNLNPETIGHLPMDLQPVDPQMLSEILNMSLSISGTAVDKISSQMLLICGWKTIKESSLSLAALCNRLWWPSDISKLKKDEHPQKVVTPLLGPDEITSILRFFEHYLRHLRHRGAFEQAYSGFSIVTKRLWSEPSYKELLIEMLNSILRDISEETSDIDKEQSLKAYVTRRSAGIPFVVQAILTAEHKHDSQTLRRVLDHLFEVLDAEKTKTYQRIHCLNILTALIKEHRLGEKVITYVDRTFSITLRSFLSDSFPIRNCANMLLKAAVERTFGVNRLRDYIHRKNQLSFERFFSQSNQLQKIMLGILQTSPYKSHEHLAAVHAVFIILFRLKPSINPSKEFCHEVTIQPFIGPTTQLALHCQDLKLCEIAAKQAARLESFCAIRDLAQLNLSMDQLDWNQIETVYGRLHLLKNRLDYFFEGIKANELTEEGLVDVLNPTMQLVVDICTSKEVKVTYTLKSAALDIAEVLAVYSARYRLDLPISQDLLNSLRVDLRELPSRQVTPQAEAYIFKLIVLILMNLSRTAQVQVDEHIQSLFLEMIEFICSKPGRNLSISLQAALLRFIRQQLNLSGATFVDMLLDKLDMDLTATHLAPKDKLKSKSENDAETELWSNYCSQSRLAELLKNQSECIQNSLLDLERYSEFNIDPQVGRFTPRSANTARSVELLALACDIPVGDKFGVDKCRTQVKLMLKLISTLPDCDIKCLSILYTAKALSEVSDEEEDLHLIEQFTVEVDELTNGDHSTTVRETCCEVVVNFLMKLALRRQAKLQTSVTNLLSALIKLSQDEDIDIRRSALTIVSNLPSNHTDCNAGSCPELPTHVSRLSPLINFITRQLFDPSNDSDVSRCVGLLLRLIFNHAKNYSNDIGEERERLFDKTKLNTFADHVATIRCSLNGLQTFLNAKDEQLPKLELDSLDLSEDIKVELELIDTPGCDNVGDYSWRRAKLKEDATNLHKGVAYDGDYLPETNSQLVDNFIVKLTKSLDYFSSGYRNMLIDTEYTYHELSLFKRMVFLRFVLSCTNHDLKNGHQLLQIRDRLYMIATRECTTTMLCNCLELIR